MIEKLFRFLNRIVLDMLVIVEIHGQALAEAVVGPHILVANHLGFIDGFLLYYVSWHEDLIAVIAEKYERNPFFRWLGRQLDVIFIDRYAADIRSFRKVYRRLQRGGVLAIAPEGTRSPSGSLIAGKQGAAYLSMKLGLPVVPAAFIGSQDRLLLESWKKLKRPKIQVRFGKPFLLDPLTPEGRSEAVADGLDEIMCRIADLLPEEYRGVYADHPKLVVRRRELETYQSSS